MRGTELDHHERREEQPGDDEQADRPGRRPAGVVRVDDRVDEQGQARGDRYGSRSVEVLHVGRGVALGHEHEDERHREEPDGHVEQEDPLPADRVGDHATDDQPERGARRADGAPDAESLVALGSFAERGHDDRERRGCHHGSADALQGTRGDHRGLRPGETREERCGDEEQKPDHEHAAAPEQVGGPTAEEQEPAEGQCVRAHDPLQVGGREAEIGLDRWQRHIHDGHVENDHEEGGAENGKRLPASRVELFLGADRVFHVVPSVSLNSHRFSGEVEVGTRP